MADSTSSPDKEKRRAHHHRGESHGVRDDIDEDTPIGDVKGPNVFERAKEEFEAIGGAIIEAIHHNKESQNHQHSSSPSSHVVNWNTFKAQSNSGKPGAHSGESHGLRDDLDEETPINAVKAPNVFERAKEEIEAIGEAIGEALHIKKEPENNHDSSPSHFENWGSVKTELNSGKPDAHSGTHIEEVKGPSVFARAKGEFEALLGAIHPKKESNDSVATPKKNEGFTVSIGKGLEKICSPKNHKHDD